MQRLGHTLSVNNKIEIHALGICDSAFAADAVRWQPVQPKAYAYHGPYSIGFSREMAVGLAATSPDVVHTHGLFYYTSAIASEWGRKFKKPYLITPHGMLDPWALKNSYWKKMIAGWLFENRHLKGSHCIHSLCGAETQAIRRYGLRKQKLCQIPNGIDLPDTSRILPAPWKVENGKKVLLFLSRVHPKKGLGNLLTAWATIRPDCPESGDWALGIAGWDQGNHEAELKLLARELNIEDSVLFLGPRFNDDKAACYHNADGFILPSFSEGLPMVVLEAWAYGLPVLITPQCNIPVGFSAGAAIQIQTESVSIQHGLRDFFRLHENERKFMGQRGRKLVEEQFTWDMVAESMYSVYQWVLGGGQPPSCVITD